MRQIFITSILWKLMLIMAIAVILTASLISWAGFRFARDSLTEQIQYRLETIAHDREARIMAYVNKVHKEVELVSSRTRLRKYLHDNKIEPENTPDFLEGTKRILNDAKSSSSDFIDILITDINGIVVTATNDDYLTKDFSENIDYIEGTKHSHLGIPQESDKGVFSYLTTPALTNNDEYLGVVIVIHKVERLRHILEDNIGLGNTGKLLIATIDNMQLKYLLADNTHSQYLSDAPMMVRAINESSSGQGISTYDGQTVLISWKPVSFQSRDFRHWGMVVKIDEDEAFAPIAELNKNQFILQCILVLVAFILSFFLARHITKPVQAIATTAEKISEGDLTARVQEGTRDELGRLAIAFNHMSDELLKSYSSLEQRVEERTSDLKHTKEALERSNTALQQFAYMASHDLKAPLKNIMQFSQLLEMKYKSKLDENANEFIGFIVSSAAHMNNLIEDLLSFSRVDSSEKPFELVSLNDAISESIKLLSTDIEGSKAIINSNDLPEILCDKSQMIQLFQNLLGNAIKYYDGDSQPEVQISADKKDDMWVISVKDNGIGIESENQEKIFQVFKRLHTNSRFSGTGIGLAICVKIIERHHGKLWVESKSGVGSTFYFSVPDNLERFKMSDNAA
jgi:signal transduction histidine kinase